MSPALRRCLLPPSRPTGKVALDLFLIRRANEHRPIVTMTSKRSLVLCSLVAIVSIAVANSFHILIMRGSKQQSCLIPRSNTRLYVETRGGANGKTKFGQSTNVDDRFLSDFKTADGSSVDPYKMLQVSRSATSAEIKQSYRRLSRKLHPDMVAQSDVLPGRCTNLADVRDEWERVKLSYEILSDPKTRKNYDRNSSVAEVLKDPGGAVGRAVVGGAMSGIGLVLGGAWKLGEMATKKVYETAVAEKEKGPGKKSMLSQEPASNPPDTRRNSVVTTVESNDDTQITPGSQGSVRYNHTSNPRSTPMPGSPTAKTRANKSPIPVSLTAKDTTRGDQIPMPENIDYIPAPMIAMEATGKESKTDASTSPGLNGITKEDTGDVNKNTITLPSPETGIQAAVTKKKRKSSQKGKKGVRKID